MNIDIIIIEFLESCKALSIKEILEIIREVLTIIGLAAGLWFGPSSIRRYLLRDILRDKFTDIQNSNKRVFEFTKEILSLLSEKLSPVKHLTVDEFSEIKEITSKLARESNGASSQVHTLSVYLDHTINNIEPTIKKDNYYEARLSNEFYGLLYATCSKINFYANNVIDLPSKSELEYYSELKKEFKEYHSEAGYYKLKDYRFGLDISSTSAITLIFYNILDSSTNNSVFAKRFLSFIHSNRPVILRMFAEKFYFPPILKSKEENMIGYEFLHLVKFKVHNINYVNSDKPDEKVVELFYSNILSYFGFVEGMKLDKFPNSYCDDYLNIQEKLESVIEKVSKKPEETITFKCNYNDLHEWFNKNKDHFHKRLLEDKQKS